jgi:hypothetical protein
MAMCHVCLRSFLIGERYRLWTQRGRAGERPVCRLCEDDIERAGWVRLDRPLQRETGSLIWRVRKVA